MLVVIGIIVFIIFAVFGSAYMRCNNQLKTVKEAFAILDMYLKDRWNLIPKLIEIVKGYTDCEPEKLEALIELREQNYALLGEGKKIETNCLLDEELTNLLSYLKKYQKLQDSEGYIKLGTELLKTSDKIADQKVRYNSLVREFNKLIKTAPYSFIAEAMKLKEQRLFEFDPKKRRR